MSVIIIFSTNMFVNCLLRDDESTRKKPDDISTVIFSVFIKEVKSSEVKNLKVKGACSDPQPHLLF